MPKKQNYSCLVSGCVVKENRRKFSIPRNEHRRKLWLLNIQREDLLSENYNKLTQFIVCRRHFPDNLFINNETLKFDAVPSINIDFSETCSSQDGDIEQPTFVPVPLSPQPSTSQEEDCQMERTDDSNSEIHNVPFSGLSMENSASGITLRDMGVTRTKSLTPREHKMYLLQRKQKKVIRQLKAKFLKVKAKDKQRKQNLLIVQNFDSFSPALRTFLSCQLRCSKTKSRVFTKFEKSLFLSIYRKLGFSSYNFLKQLFPFLPSIRTIQRTRANKDKPDIHLKTHL